MQLIRKRIQKRLGKIQDFGNKQKTVEKCLDYLGYEDVYYLGGCYA